MSSAPQLVVGTAGHIDHGKSSLVRALTGIDPDRLPEEKARGMTIDLGFAYARFADADVWFVDVPGHERFIRNMVAGATGIDAALLIVAADDSVMLQTREHAEVLALLGVERVVIVVTKIDLVEREWAEQVAAEARQLLAGLGIRAHTTVLTSIHTGAGLDELKAALAALARQKETLPAGPASAWFRMPVDRAFLITGRGTVVTGSVAHGEVSQDAELELWPAGARVRVRDLQSHHDARSSAAGRMRLALNLAGVALEDVGRGCELATPGYLTAATCFDAALTVLRMPGKQVRNRVRLRLHIATSEVLAEVRLIDSPPGTDAIAGAAPAVRGAFAQIRTAAPLVAAYGQRFILRDESGSRTLGGGRIINPVATPWSARHRPDRAGLERLAGGAPRERAAEIVRVAGWADITDAQLAARAGLCDAAQAAAARAELIAAGRLRTVEAGTVRAVLHDEHLKALAASVGERLKRHMAANPRSPGVPRQQWPGWMPRACPERLRPALAEWLISSGAVALAGAHIVPPRAQAALPSADQALLDAVLAEFHAAGFSPPGLEALRCRTPRNERRLRELVELAAARRQLVRLGDGLWLDGRRWDELVRQVAAAIRTRGPLTVADIRTLLNSSRKYVVPIVEQLDAAGVTRRVGDQRTLGPAAPPG